MTENDAHHWSGWPGAFCLKCGSVDPNEQALADGLIHFVEDPNDPEAIMEVWTGTPDQKAALIAAGVCPVKGVLEWSTDEARWVLKPPVLPQEPTSAPDPDQDEAPEPFDWQCMSCGAWNPSEYTHCPECWNP